MDILRSLPLGLYLEQPITWLHRLDPRVKLFWLMGFLLTPVLASDIWRIALVIALILLTIVARIPLRVWKQQLGWLSTLCLLIFVMTAITPDGLLANHTAHRPADSLTLEGPKTPLALLEKDERIQRIKADKAEAAEAKKTQKEIETAQGASQSSGILTRLGFPGSSSSPYRYILFSHWFVTVSQRSLDLAIRVSTLIFTLIYSTNLYLLTTAPEEITAGLEDLMLPLRWIGVPVTEMALTLTLSLRYIPLVLEEIQNLGRSIWTRAINWKELGMRRGLRVWLIVAERLLDNLLLRASQAANAMQVRGFTGPNRHRVQWHDLRLKRRDWVAIASLILFFGLRIRIGGEL